MPYEQENRTPRETGRDLMPIIVIFGFAIVMTIVVVTIFSFFRKGEGNEPEQTEQHVLEAGKHIADGETAFQAKNWDRAKDRYESAYQMLNGRKNPNPEILLLEIEICTRLCEISAERQDMKSARHFAGEAKRLRAELQTMLDRIQERMDAKMRLPDIPPQTDGAGK